jgi:hypothetical protein
MDCSVGTSDQNLLDDDAAEAGLSTFHTRGMAYCDRHNVWWRKQGSGIPSSDIHTFLAGAPNEFVMTAQCTRADYRYVLGQLRSLNS